MALKQTTFKNFNFGRQKRQILNLLKKAYEELPKKGIYETFDYAEFLKNNELFEESIIYYTNILKVIKKDHPLYPRLLIVESFI